MAFWKVTTEDELFYGNLRTGRGINELNISSLCLGENGYTSVFLMSSCFTVVKIIAAFLEACLCKAICKRQCLLIRK